MDRKLELAQIADVSSHTFAVPKRGILAQGDLGRWLESAAATSLLDFVVALNESVAGKRVADVPPAGVSPAVSALLRVLDQLGAWVGEIPPEQQAQRFGNRAFRKYYDRLAAHALPLTRDVLAAAPAVAALPEEVAAAVAGEVAPYLTESVGNSTRIDYGTGHELAFAAFLAALTAVGALTQQDFPALVLHVFARYLAVMRSLQKVYIMEPAGSHGVWGLDDFQFLPFLWGSAQFLDHPRITPKSILNVDMVEDLAPDYLFMAGIKFIREMKRGPFAEHSPMLYDISSVPLWAKVNLGLHKMYAAEVLGKFPVVQHFLFGSIFTLAPTTNPNPFVRALKP